MADSDQEILDFLDADDPVLWQDGVLVADMLESWMGKRGVEVHRDPGGLDMVIVEDHIPIEPYLDSFWRAHEDKKRRGTRNGFRTSHEYSPPDRHIIVVEPATRDD